MPRITDEITPELAAAVLDQLGRGPLSETERAALAKGEDAEPGGGEPDVATALGATDGPAPADVLHGEDVMRARMCGHPVPDKSPTRLRGLDAQMARMRGDR